jgi:hypothetical protein
MRRGLAGCSISRRLGRRAAARGLLLGLANETIATVILSTANEGSISRRSDGSKIHCCRRASGNLDLTVQQTHYSLAICSRELLHPAREPFLLRGAGLAGGLLLFGIAFPIPWRLGGQPH